MTKWQLQETDTRTHDGYVEWTVLTNGMALKTMPYSEAIRLVVRLGKPDDQYTETDSAGKSYHNGTVGGLKADIERGEEMVRSWESE